MKKWLKELEEVLPALIILFLILVGVAIEAQKDPIWAVIAFIGFLIILFSAKP